MIFFWADKRPSQSRAGTGLGARTARQQQPFGLSGVHREPHPELAGDVQRKHSGIPLRRLRVLMPHQRLDHLLRHLVHRKRIPERLRRHRPDGKRHAVTRRRRDRLRNPAARRVLALNVPQPAAAPSQTTPAAAARIPDR